MAIRIINRDMDIPVSDRTIGYTGNNLVETRVFELPRFYNNIDLAEFNIVLETQIGGVKDIIALERNVTGDNITLTWVITERNVLYPGQMEIQLRAFKGTIEKWHSGKGYVRIRPGINAPSSQPDLLPSEFHQVEARATVAKNEAQAAAQTATEQAGIATTKAQEASDSADRAWQSEQAAKASEDMAKISEDNAKDSEVAAGKSEGIASQALADLLAMLGTDIATLVNGKLTPSQIPSIAINDTFPVADTNEMLLLEAQRGDCAVIMQGDVVTDSYILAGDDPAILENWTKLGISYVAEAGHAQTATNAENAAMINNHRVVVMTQEQYDQAVLDPDTVYLVSGV